jgi:hypothetical protein
MWLVTDKDKGMYVFLHQDDPPHVDADLVVEDVELEIPAEIKPWVPGEMESTVVVGRARNDDHKFRIFPSRETCNQAKYEPLGKNFTVKRSWQAYLATRQSSG